jgi:ABC-2 type transport system ATP-binding protein
VITEGCASAVELVASRTGQPGVIDGEPGVLRVQASDHNRFVHVLPQVARSNGIRLYQVSPADESLESVFAYLVSR